MAAEHPFDSYVREYVCDDPGGIDVGRAALLFALDAYPNLSVSEYLGFLDELAERVVAEAGRREVSVPIRWAALRRVLVEQVGLTGQVEPSYDPQDCHLNQVLDSRRGLPVSFSCIWIAVGRRVGWRICGLAMPEHFAVCIDGPDGRLFADPACNGLLLN
ncbi:MAG: transglutaminase family protein, partial [Phycisphaerae bacterium]